MQRMLPPVDEAVLSANVRFHAIYNDLSTTKLNPDGTSKVDGKAQVELSEELRRARLTVAKKDLIKSCLSNLAYRGDELPEELRGMVAVVAAVLDSPLSGDDVSLLRNDMGKFKDNAGAISHAVAAELKAQAALLLDLVPPTSPSHGRNIAEYVAGARTSIAADEEAVARLRLDLAQEAALIHRTYCHVFESSIRILEQTIHGAVARNTRAKAAYLATVAEGMHKKLLLQHRQLLLQAQSPELQDALTARLSDLDREVLVLRRRNRDAEEKLAEYRSAKAVAGLAQEYAEIRKQTSLLRADIARLQQEAS